MRISPSVLGLVALGVSACGPKVVDCTEKENAFVDASQEWFGEYEYRLNRRIKDEGLDLSAERVRDLINNDIEILCSNGEGDGSLTNRNGDKVFLMVESDSFKTLLNDFHSSSSDFEGVTRREDLDWAEAYNLYLESLANLSGVLASSAGRLIYGFEEGEPSVEEEKLQTATFDTFESLTVVLPTNPDDNSPDPGSPF